MLDIKWVREHASEVRQDLEKRGSADKIVLVEEIIGKDEEWRKAKVENDRLRSERNRLSQQINEAKKAGGDTEELLRKVREIPPRIKRLDERMEALQEEIKRRLLRLPNITDPSVPVGDSEEENEEVGLYGTKPAFPFPPKNHTEIVQDLGLVDLERAAKISGSRFYTLKGDLALLEHALQAYALQFMTRQGYVPMMPPHMLKREAYEGVTDLADFEEVLYKVEGHDLHLIATSEHPLTAQFMNETLPAEQLPIRIVGLSPCYRKETGSHGREEKGIWRVHHFNKIEQVIICRPGESQELHEELIRNAREFFESLGIHFRQVLICTGDLGIVASKKYDLEAWIPSVGQYKEIVSASNCTSYQAVRLGVRYAENHRTGFVHTLNATCCATSRALVAILEQFQNEDGTVTIPEPLQKRMGKKRLSRAP